MLHNVHLHHIMFLEVVDFFVKTLNFDILQLLFVLLCLLVPLFQECHVLLQDVSVFLEVSDHLVLLLAIPLQVLAHLLELPDGAVQIVEQLVLYLLLFFLLFLRLSLTFVDVLLELVE